jgi:hypothetical protein
MATAYTAAMATAISTATAAATTTTTTTTTTTVLREGGVHDGQISRE